MGREGNYFFFFFLQKPLIQHFDFELHALRKCTECCSAIEVIKRQWFEFFLHLTLYVNIILEDLFSNNL